MNNVKVIPATKEVIKLKPGDFVRTTDNCSHLLVGIVCSPAGAGDELRIAWSNGSYTNVNHKYCAPFTGTIEVS
jgi:hypothetical protein